MHSIDVQICNWYAFDTYQERGYIVQAYGRTRNGASICVDMEHYKPSLLIYLADQQKTFFITHGTNFVQTLKRMFPKETRGLENNVSFVMKKRLYPYTAVFAEKFLKICFNSEYSRKQTTNILRSLSQNTCDPLMNFGKFCLYDGTNLNAYIMMQHELRIKPHGWVRVHCEYDRFDYSKQSVSCEQHVRVPYTSVTALDSDDIVPIRISSFDLECLSFISWKTHDSIFPDYRNTQDTVSQIGVCTWIFGETAYDKRVFVLDDENWFSETDEKQDDFIVVPCQTEQLLLLTWARYIRDMDIDILVGYNIFGFDYEYLYERARFHKINEEFIRTLSRRYLSNKERTDFYYSTRRLASSAYGDNTFKIVNIPGRMSLDLYVLIKKEHKLESYKLDDVAELFINQHKNDLKPAELFQSLKTSKESCLRVASYCIMDCILVIELLQRLQTLPNLLEMANITRVTIDMLILRGQQIKCFSLIAYEAYHLNIAVPDTVVKNEHIVTENDDEKYTGATVLEPKRGAYMQERITVLDFASLYPSLMIAYNLCFSTLVKNNNTAINSDCTHRVMNTHVFVKKEVCQGVLPKILIRLWEQRKAVKRLMKETEDSTVLSVLNGRQLAIKVSMNSMYGFCGATHGILPCRAIAESITALGRDHIILAKSKVEELYACTVVYGDSDSIYVHLHCPQTMQETFDLSTTVQNKLNESFVYPVQIEFEKVYFPLILFTKKRYCSLVWETPDFEKTHTEYKGISIVRRDFCKFTRETLDNSMKMVLFNRDIKKAHEYVLESIRDLMQGRVHTDKLIMTKTLSAKYSKEDKENPMPHVSVMVKMRQRDPNNYPKSGERVPFLFINNGERLLKDRAEHPVFVEENRLHIDYLYYLENQLHKPCKEVFDILLHPLTFDPYSHIKTEMYLLQKQRDQLIRSCKNRNNGQNEITQFFTKKPKTEK